MKYYLIENKDPKCVVEKTTYLKWIEGITIVLQKTNRYTSGTFKICVPESREEILASLEARSLDEDHLEQQVWLPNEDDANVVLDGDICDFEMMDLSDEISEDWDISAETAPGKIQNLREMRDEASELYLEDSEAFSEEWEENERVYEIISGITIQECDEDGEIE